MDNFKNRLILYTNGATSEDIELECITVLQKNKLIGDQWQYQNEDFYLAGSDFSNLVMFCGCSPCIEFKPQDNGELGSSFLAIQFRSLAQYNFYAGKQPFKYSCSSCNASIRMKNHQLNSKDSQKNFFLCPQCSHQYFYHKINWRRKAGVGQFFIEIRGVFESEAIPSDKLLQLLNSVTDSKWHYFYADESSLPLQLSK